MGRTVTIICGLVMAVLANHAAGQAMVLKDGTRVSDSDFRVENGQIKRTIKLQGDKTAESTVQASQIMQLDWPYPAELTEARSLMAQGKSGEALEALVKGKAFFEPFKDIKGGDVWYRDLFFTYVETLVQAGKFEEAVKLLPEVQIMPLTDEQKTRLKIVRLDIERQTTSNYVSILAQAQNILSETDDLAICAAVWSIIGDIHTKQKEYEKALMAYLRIPVFYGTQMQRVPEAELNAARSLVKMKRYEDATKFFTRLAETYPGSVIAEAATKEKAAINGLKNEPEAIPGKDEKDKAAEPAKS